jgi:predicted DCC family thiol-disulfide oxidoreductase YuxK
VRFIIPRDKRARIRFAALQSDFAQRLLRDHNIPADLNTIVFIESGRAYRRSTACLRLTRYLDGAWKLLWLLIAIPAPFRDWLYDLFASHRYRIFGRTETCLIPTPEIQSRFVA